MHNILVRGYSNFFADVMAPSVYADIDMQLVWTMGYGTSVN